MLNSRASSPKLGRNAVLTAFLKVPAVADPKAGLFPRPQAGPLLLNLSARSARPAASVPSGFLLRFHLRTPTLLSPGAIGSLLPGRSSQQSACQRVQRAKRIRVYGAWPLFRFRSRGAQTSESVTKSSPGLAGALRIAENRPFSVLSSSWPIIWI